jgi:DNA-binding PucR family transcriptional regulator
VLLRELQRRLAGLYDAPAEHDVYDFLITDAAHAAALQGAAAAPPTDEQLLVVEEEDGVGISLYLDRAVIERLAERCPLQSLCDENLGDFCTALEGVSHFHYFVWSAGMARPVSLLELELQAEVDKYASALQILLQQRAGRFPGELFERLFDRAGFLPHLPPQELTRYEEAHRFAARFCRRLEERFLRRRQARPDALLAELRTFYRLGRHAKLRHAEQWR